ncbi:type II toxin-antitoxin system VapC family toxin [Streptosporangium lutulentum]|uniref:Nucleic acid-binding protein n=1 Tax=Streptosporangium lutulentum TaxID=1461250 RepID=A0ABT9QKI1_9ACTN|nr:PIN domain-containing protein [Streptosporangium lutulentum]MDP9847261.1 putative nucleic acid-binding protein [Streptosporangium lutulentum]
MIVVDTGPIVAAAIRNDRKHDVCVEVFNQFRRERRELLVPSFVAGEVSYMLGKIGGAKVEAGFLRSLRSGVFHLVDLIDDDLARIADLVERYADLPLGSADASVVAVAERFRIPEVFTVDNRDFSVVRPAHVAAFTLVPG